MTRIPRRLLVAFLLVECAVCGWLVGGRLLRRPPALPGGFPDDPLVGAELAAIAARADGGAAGAWLELGQSLLGQGLYGHAEAALRRAVAAEPTAIEPAFALGFALDRTGRMREGNALFDRCLALSEPGPGPSKKPFALYQIGRNHLRDGDVAAAEGAFRRNAGVAQAEHQLARILLHSGRPKEAAEVVSRALGRIPLALELHHERMRVMEALDRPDEAFRSAALEERSAHLVEVSFNTDYVRPFHARHGLRRLVDDHLAREATSDHASSMARLDAIDAAIGDRTIPERSATRRLRAVRLLQAGQADRVLELVAEMKAAGDRGPGVLETEAAARRLRGEPDAALALLLRATTMEPTAARHRQLADEYDRRGDAAARDRHRAALHFHEGIAAYRQNRLDAALESLRKSLALDDANATTWFHAGELEYHLGRPEAADEAFRRALAVRPGYGRARDYLERRPP
jgi:tetratricopeptide (TPR) repeat protein